MSSRPQASPFHVIKDGDMSGSLTSQVTIIQKLSLISYSISWAGSAPVGAISVQVSNDYKEDSSGQPISGSTWNTLVLDAATDISGSTGNGFIDIDLNAGYAMRLLYTRTSGTGTLQVVMTAKVA